MAVAEPAIAFRPRLLLDGQQGRESLTEYQRRGGYAVGSWAYTPDALRSIVDASGLRGRGGSAFPAGRKWQSVAAEPGPRVLLVNGAE
ncbi:MAG TPA: NADH-quinone oxidoreductase subunit F, partial [Chloroflexota bacterium]